MNSRSHTGIVKPISTGSARAVEPSRLMAPRPVKFLTEHSIDEVALVGSLPLDPAAAPQAHHRRMHSMGYGIDE